MEKIHFTGLGGCNEVGRSSFLIEFGEKIVLDRGIKLSPDGSEYPLPVLTNLDAVIISHAHLDHSGALPDLFVNSSILSYMTAPALSLSEILWFDTLKIAGLESQDISFSKDEVNEASKFTFPVEYKRVLHITKSCSMQFFDAGHILGSAMPLLSIGEKKLLYTGDFKVEETRLFNGADLNTGKVDYLAIESTYGDRNHPPRKECEKMFIEEIRETLDSGGTALVPAFAVGRSQEIIDVLHEHKINAPIYLDGMGQKVARSTLNFPKYLKNPRFLKKALENTIWVRNNSDRNKALKQPSVIVTTAGMLQGGPALNYLKHIYKDEKSNVFLTGFQVEETPGRILMETGKIDIDGKYYEVRGKVEKFDFSAHASQHEMLKAIGKWQPEKILLVHGDKDVIQVFKKKIEEETGIEVLVPEAGKKICLSDSK